MSFHGAFSFSVPIELKFLVSLVLPYIEVPNIPLGPVRVYPFGILVIAGILTGIRMILWRASKRGLDRQIAFRLCAITALFGLAGSYLLRLLFFSRGGIYSFGGLLSGLAGGACYLRWTKLRGAAALDYIDVLAFAFPFAWAFGRAGCSVAHDHPGVRTSSWLAVRFPDGPRYDLGDRKSTRLNSTLFPYTTLFRSPLRGLSDGQVAVWRTITLALEHRAGWRCAFLTAPVTIWEIGRAHV